MFAFKLALDDESIRSIIFAIDPAINVLSLLLFDDFFVFSVFASDSVFAIALRTLFNIGGVSSAGGRRGRRQKLTISVTRVYRIYPSVRRNNGGGGIVMT